jgi:hypothetical protein
MGQNSYFGKKSNSVHALVGVAVVHRHMLLPAKTHLREEDGQ